MNARRVLAAAIGGTLLVALIGVVPASAAAPEVSCNWSNTGGEWFTYGCKTDPATLTGTVSVSAVTSAGTITVWGGGPSQSDGGYVGYKSLGPGGAAGITVTSITVTATGFSATTTAPEQHNAAGAGGYPAVPASASRDTPVTTTTTAPPTTTTTGATTTTMGPPGSEAVTLITSASGGFTETLLDIGAAGMALGGFVFGCWMAWRHLRRYVNG